MYLLTVFSWKDCNLFLRIQKFYLEQMDSFVKYKHMSESRRAYTGIHFCSHWGLSSEGIKPCPTERWRPWGRPEDRVSKVWLRGSHCNTIIPIHWDDETGNQPYLQKVLSEIHQLEIYKNVLWKEQFNHISTYGPELAVPAPGKDICTGCKSTLRINEISIVLRMEPQ